MDDAIVPAERRTAYGHEYKLGSFERAMRYSQLAMTSVRVKPDRPQDLPEHFEKHIPEGDNRERLVCGRCKSAATECLPYLDT